MAPALRAVGLVKCFHAGIGAAASTVRALCGLDAEVRAGEALAVVGPPGAGKSTFLLCAAGLLRPDAGSLAWFGAASWPFGRPPGVAYAPEFPRYYPFLTVREALEHYAILRALPGRERAARVAMALVRAGLAEHAGATVGKLPRAPLQRLGVAQAIVGRPRLLLLDGALSALDPVGDADVHALLAALRDEGAAIVAAARDATEVAPIATRLLFLRDGRACGAEDARAPGARAMRVAEARRG